MKTIKHLTSRQLMFVACQQWGMDIGEFCGDSRNHIVVKCRKAFSLLARALTNESYPEIARSVNRTNHSTVLTWHKSASEQFEGDRLLRELVATGYRGVVRSGYGLAIGVKADRDLCADAFEEYCRASPEVSRA